MDQISIGIFSDTHGNILALQTILNYFKKIKVDSIFHLGDIVCKASILPCVSLKIPIEI